jgi:hypothetical protein
MELQVWDALWSWSWCLSADLHFRRWSFRWSTSRTRCCSWWMRSLSANSAYDLMKMSMITSHHWMLSIILILEYFKSLYGSCSFNFHQRIEFSISNIAATHQPPIITMRTTTVYTEYRTLVLNSCTHV